MCDGYDWRLELDRHFDPLCKCEPEEPVCPTCQVSDRLADYIVFLEEQVSACKSSCVTVYPHLNTEGKPRYDE